jgi:DNA replication and repair protein RecF
VCALKLAQGKIMASATGEMCTYLVDDLTSELDEAHGRKVAAQLTEMEAQVFVTCIEKKDVLTIWPASRPGLDSAMFHVEHGGISREHDQR